MTNDSWKPDRSTLFSMFYSLVIEALLSNARPCSLGDEVIFWLV